MSAEPLYPMNVECISENKYGVAVSSYVVAEDTREVTDIEIPLNHVPSSFGISIYPFPFWSSIINGNVHIKDLNQKIDAPPRLKRRGLIGARFLDARSVPHTKVCGFQTLRHNKIFEIVKKQSKLTDNSDNCNIFCSEFSVYTILLLCDLINRIMHRTAIDKIVEEIEGTK